MAPFASARVREVHRLTSMNKSYQLTNIIYEFTVAFCKRYVGSAQQAKSMVSLALAAKKEAKPIYLSELQEKYREFLDMNDLEHWLGYSLQLRRVRGIAFRPFSSISMYKPFLSSGERASNAAICLINQINGMLEKPVKSAPDYGDVLLLNGN